MTVMTKKRIPEITSQSHGGYIPLLKYLKNLNGHPVEVETYRQYTGMHIAILDQILESARSLGYVSCWKDEGVRYVSLTIYGYDFLKIRDKINRHSIGEPSLN